MCDGSGEDVRTGGGAHAIPKISTYDMKQYHFHSGTGLVYTSCPQDASYGPGDGGLPMFYRSRNFWGLHGVLGCPLSPLTMSNIGFLKMKLFKPFQHNVHNILFDSASLWNNFIRNFSITRSSCIRGEIQCRGWCGCRWHPFSKI